MNYICEVSGYCPIKDCDIEIDVKYISIPVLGSTQEQYKKILDYCQYSQSCPERLCPIVKSAPLQP